MDYWIWAFLLLMVSMCLAIFEVFFTSAGLLAFFSLVALIAAVFMGFQGPHGQVVGFVILALAVVGIPAVVVLAFKYWPRTAIGKRVLLSAPTSEDVLPENPGKEFLKSLVGRTAKAKSKLLPSGVVIIDGRNVEAVSEGMPIEVGQVVRIVQVRGKQVVVRPIELDTPLETDANPLHRPIDSIVEDPFRERPA